MRPAVTGPLSASNILSIALVCALASMLAPVVCDSVSAAEPAVSASAMPATAAWDVETLLDQSIASGFDISPDGRRAVWVERYLDEEGKAFHWRLMLSKLEDGPEAVRPLTARDYDSFSPRWRPDGRGIAFLSARGDGVDGKDALQQVCWLDLEGGEVELLSEAPSGVDDFRWLDARRLVFLAAEGKRLRDTRMEEAGDDTIVVGDEAHWAPTRLFLLDLEQETTRRVSDNERPIVEFATSPDGRRIVYSEAEDMHDDYDALHPPRVRLLDLASGDVGMEVLPAELRASRFVWDLKSEGFYFTYPVGSEPGQVYASLDMPGFFDLESGEWRAVEMDWARGMAWGGCLPSKKGLLIDLADGVRRRLTHVERKGDGWKPRLLKRDKPDKMDTRGVTQILALGPDGETLIYSRGDASTPSRYFSAKLGKDKLDDSAEFMRLNEQLDALPRVRSEIIRYAGARGDSVEALLYYPLDYDETERQPLIVMLHGGPADMDQDLFQETWGGSPGLFAARGAFVLRPNYHGSYGYGLGWLESIRERYYELEVTDILAGVDRLVDLGLVDESRLGIQGWSNGAILAIAACMESGQRFRVLDAGAGDINWSSDYGNCAFGAGFNDYYFGGPPWERPWVYVDKSPLFRIDELQVPTLVSFGTEDTNVPVEQGWQLYRAMRRVDRAPVRFLLFPGEGHMLMNPVHRRRQMNEQLDWFDRWLFSTHEELNEAFLAGSPLDLALRIADAARVDGLYGETLDGLLVPEFVEAAGLLVTRFELTHAQWSDWRETFAPEPESPVYAADEELAMPAYEFSDPNLPITGISWEDAEAYCAWLSALIGLDCRLPGSAELESLQSLAQGDENTLNWWAGYSPGPADAAMMSAKVTELEVNRSLLFPVGSFAPGGDSGLYDLGGNAAEMALDRDDEGVARIKVLGAHALSVADSLSAPAPARPLYTGLRIVAPLSSSEGEDADD